MYEQTIQSRGKGPEFWQPYVEEWDNPPKPSKSSITAFASTFFARTLIKSTFLLRCTEYLVDVASLVALTPLHLVPVAGIVISAWLRALGTARYLHKPVRGDQFVFRALQLIRASQYFKAKAMTPEQIAVFIEERKWDYRSAYTIPS